MQSGFKSFWSIKWAACYGRLMVIDEQLCQCTKFATNGTNQLETQVDQENHKSRILEIVPIKFFTCKQM
jgi:hypothetical protein